MIRLLCTQVRSSVIPIAIGTLLLAVCAVAAVGLVAGCAVPSEQGMTPSESLAEFTSSDMSGYACFEGCTGDTVFVDMTVADVVRKMDAGATFAFYTGYADCPWCNVVAPALNEQALVVHQPVGYINTRANPEWKSNMDIDNYDVFVERFASALDTDDDGSPHLYVPHVFFIKNGQLVYDHSGTVPGQESPDQALTNDQQEELASYFAEGFTTLV